MKKQEFPVKCIVALGFMFLEQWIGKWSPFEDQDFLCGVLLGAGIVLMLQAVYEVGRAVARKKDG